MTNRCNLGLGLILTNHDRKEGDVEDDEDDHDDADVAEARRELFPDVKRRLNEWMIDVCGLNRIRIGPPGCAKI